MVVGLTGAELLGVRAEPVSWQQLLWQRPSADLAGPVSFLDTASIVGEYVRWVLVDLSHEDGTWNQ